MSGEGSSLITASTIRGWFHAWEQLIGSVDYDAARELFTDDVVAFGTVARVVLGLDALENQQWRSVWGRIEGFEFDLDGLVAGTSADELTGWGACLWSSTGHLPDGTAFHRPGRCTAVLSRRAVDHPWRAVHTHLSLVP